MPLAETLLIGFVFRLTASRRRLRPPLAVACGLPLNKHAGSVLKYYRCWLSMQTACMGSLPTSAHRPKWTSTNSTLLGLAAER